MRTLTNILISMIAVILVLTCFMVRWDVIGGRIALQEIFDLSAGRLLDYLQLMVFFGPIFIFVLVAEPWIPYSLDTLLILLLGMLSLASFIISFADASQQLAQSGAAITTVNILNATIAEFTTGYWIQFALFLVLIVLTLYRLFDRPARLRMQPA